MSTEMTVAFIVLAVWSAVFTAAYIGRAVPEPEAEERFKEEKEPVCSRSLSANSLRPLRALAVRNERRFATE